MASAPSAPSTSPPQLPSPTATPHIKSSPCARSLSASVQHITRPCKTARGAPQHETGIFAPPRLGDKDSMDVDCTTPAEPYYSLASRLLVSHRTLCIRNNFIYLALPCIWSTRWCITCYEKALAVLPPNVSTSDSRLWLMAGPIGLVRGRRYPLLAVGCVVWLH